MCDSPSWFWTKYSPLPVFKRTASPPLSEQFSNIEETLSSTTPKEAVAKSVVRFRHATVIQRLVECLLVNAGLAGDLA